MTESLLEKENRNLDTPGHKRQRKKTPRIYDLFMKIKTSHPVEPSLAKRFYLTHSAYWSRLAVGNGKLTIFVLVPRGCIDVIVTDILLIIECVTMKLVLITIPIR